MLLTRLLIEFLRISGRPLVGYDLDPREPASPAVFRVWSGRSTSPIRAVKWRYLIAFSRSLAHDGHRSRPRAVRSIL
jgi:hypothetical protein